MLHVNVDGKTYEYLASSSDVKRWRYGDRVVVRDLCREECFILFVNIPLNGGKTRPRPWTFRKGMLSHKATSEFCNVM